MTEIGHNSMDKGLLKQFVERVERLNEEKQALNADIKEVFSEAKGTGFDIKILRKVIALRKLDPATVKETDALMAVYCHALGMEYLE